MEHSTEELKRRADIVAVECGGVQPIYEAFYIHSLIYAASSSVAAFIRYDQAILHNGRPAEVVAQIHEALTHASAVSRFFWPSRASPLSTARGMRLRAAFQLTEASPLHDRELRNALEHYDERLDAFLLRDLAGAVLPAPLIGSAEMADEPLRHVFRLLDPLRQELVLLGKRYRFASIRGDIERVHRIALGMDGRGARL